MLGVVLSVLAVVCKWMQHCCALLWRSWNKRNVRTCWLQTLNHFNLCATTPKNTQQQATTCNTGCPNGCNMYSNLQKCSVCLHGALDDKVVLTVKTDYIIRVSMDVDPHWPFTPSSEANGLSSRYINIYYLLKDITFGRTKT